MVVLGEYDLTGDIEKLKPVSRPVRRMIVHRNYNPNTFENDIALLELESPFDIQPHVVPICLPEPDEKSYVGKLGYVAGWGKLSYGMVAKKFHIANGSSLSRWADSKHSPGCPVAHFGQQSMSENVPGSGTCKSDQGYFPLRRIR